MNNKSRITGPKSFTREEAMEILSECIEIRLSLDELEEIATAILSKPQLSLVKTNKLA